MPLPFAPPPSQSKVYADLKNLKLSEVTADQFDSLKGALFAQGVDSSEDEMRRLTLVGQVSNQQSASGAIPGTGTFVSETQADDSGTLDLWLGDSYPGEVWQLVAASIIPNNTGIRVRLRLYNVAQTIKIELGDETGHGSSEPFDPTATWGGPFRVDENMRLRAYCDGMAAGRSVEVNICLIRVR